MTEDVLEDIWRLTRNELEVDYVGIWELISEVRDRLPGLDEDGVQSSVLALVGGGLRRQEVRAGVGAAVGGLECVGQGQWIRWSSASGASGMNSAETPCLEKLSGSTSRGQTTPFSPT